MKSAKIKYQGICVFSLILSACNGGGTGNNSNSQPIQPSQIKKVSYLGVPADYGRRGVSFDLQNIGRKKEQKDLFKYWERKNSTSNKSLSKSGGLMVPISGYNPSISSPGTQQCFQASLVTGPENTTYQVSSQSAATTILNQLQIASGDLETDALAIFALAGVHLGGSYTNASSVSNVSSVTTYEMQTTLPLAYTNYTVNTVSPVGQNETNAQLGVNCGANLITGETGTFSAYIEVSASSSNSNYADAVNLAFNRNNFYYLVNTFVNLSNLVTSSNSAVQWSINVTTMGGRADDINLINSKVSESSGQECLQGNSASCGQWVNDINAALSNASANAVQAAQNGNTGYLSISANSVVSQPITQVMESPGFYATAIDPYASMESVIGQSADLAFQLSNLGEKANNLNSALANNPNITPLGNTSTMLNAIYQGYSNTSQYIIDTINNNCLTTPSLANCSIPSSLTNLFNTVAADPAYSNSVSTNTIPYLVANFSALQMSGTYNDSYGSSYSYSKDVTPIEPSSSDSLNLLYYNCASEWDYATGNVSAGTIVSCINNGYNTAGILSVAGTSPIAVQPLVINNNGTPAVTVFNINPYYSNSTNSILSNGVGYIFYVNSLDSFGSTPTGSYFDNGVIYNGYVNFPAWGIDNGYFSYIQDPLSVNLYPNGYPLNNSNTSCQFSTDTSCTITLTVPNTNVQTQDSILLQYSPNWPAFVYPN